MASSQLNGATIGPDSVAADPPTSLGNCPECGRAYGKIRRCYSCKPGLNRAPGPRTRLASVESLDLADRPPAAGTPPTRPVAPPDVARALADARRELEAKAAVVAALEGLDAATFCRVVRWAKETFEAMPTGG